MYDVSIIIVAYNSSGTIRDCVQSLIDYAPRKFMSQIVVVDNASSDNSADIVENEFSDVLLLKLPENTGFGRGNNAGMAAAPARYYYLHNADAYLQDNVLDNALAYLDDTPATGIAGLPLVFPDHSPQTAAYSHTTPLKWTLQALGIDRLARWMITGPFSTILKPPLERLPMGDTFARTHSREGQVTSKARSVDWVCGAALILREEVRTALGGGFDPIYFLYAEDEDLCIEAKKRGWTVEQLPVTPVIHEFGWGQVKKARNTTIARLKIENLEIFVNKHFRGFSRLYMRAFLRLQMMAWGLSR